jgi:hypothetical protein
MDGVHPIATARATLALHSSLVGHRQSPGDDPSVNPQSPSFRPAAAWFAAAHAAFGKQSACCNQISPVTVSVTVPFWQFT